MLQNQAQILQSPARLGLTNPNSPSFSNPPTTPKLSSQIQQQQHHLQQQQQQQQTPLPAAPVTTTTTTTSSTLLPPLSRAQSLLLLQMASLASKLFEVSPNRSLWLASFRGSLPTFLASQTLTLLNPPPIDPPPPTSSTKEIISLFTNLQTQLFESVAELQEILDLQDAKNKIAREIRNKDSAMLAFANKLKEAEHVLDLLLVDDDYSDYHHRPKRSKLDDTTTTVNNGDDNGECSSSTTSSISSSLNLSDILSYAHRISYTTFAPPEFGAGQAPLRNGALPPAPQDEQMRASQLYNFADLDVGVPKRVESKEKTIETLMEAPPAFQQQPTDANPLGGDLKGLIPHLTVPSGWRPGMPVELPSDLPIMPPAGWKPGDPIPLPPLDALVPEEQQPRPAVPQMPGRGAEPIQVRYVQLDINPDEDDSSDYSSDGSSDEDDED